LRRLLASHARAAGMDKESAQATAADLLPGLIAASVCGGKSA